MTRKLDWNDEDIITLRIDQIYNKRIIVLELKTKNKRLYLGDSSRWIDSTSWQN